MKPEGHSLGTWAIKATEKRREEGDSAATKGGGGSAVSDGQAIIARLSEQTWHLCSSYPDTHTSERPNFTCTDDGLCFSLQNRNATKGCWVRWLSSISWLPNRMLKQSQSSPHSQDAPTVLSYPSIAERERGREGE